MLSWDPRWAFKEGNIQVQTEYPYYEPGQTVTGKVFILANQPIMTTGITVEISGKEVNKFIRFWNEHRHHPPANEGEPGRTEIIEHREKLKQKNHFCDTKQKLVSLQGIPPGAHCVGFSFTLPDGLPSSFFFKNGHVREKPSAKAKYHIKVKLEGTDVKSKQVLLIREKPVKMKEGESQFEKSKISTCCCIP